MYTCSVSSDFFYTCRSTDEIDALIKKSLELYRTTRIDKDPYAYGVYAALDFLFGNGCIAPIKECWGRFTKKHLAKCVEIEKEFGSIGAVKNRTSVTNPKDHPFSDTPRFSLGNADQIEKSLFRL